MSPAMMPGEYAPYGAGNVQPNLFRDISMHTPKLPSIMGYTAMRGGRTIRLGGFARSGNDIGTIRGGLRNNLDPRSWFRLGSADYFDPTRKFKSPQWWHNEGLEKRFTGTPLEKFFKPARDKTAYSTFNAAQQMNEYMPRFANKLLSKTTEGSRASSALRYLNTENIIDAGAMSRLGAMGQIRLGAKVNPAAMAKYYDAIGISGMESKIAGMSRTEMFQGLGMSMEGSVTGRIGGYISASYGRGALEGAAAIPRTQAGGLASEAALRGAKRYAEHIAPLAKHMAEKGLTTEFGEFGMKAGIKALPGLFEEAGPMIAARAGLALGAGELAAGIANIWNPIGWALTAASVAQIGTAVVGAGAKLTAQAYSSQMRGLNRPMYGGVFKETEASMTSRQRGVMAISNSRLNARSVLGNESSGLYAHFG